MKVVLHASQSGASSQGRISNPLTSESCVSILCDLGLSGTAWETHSSVKNIDGRWEVENGVRVELHDCTKDDICMRFWPALQNSFDLECLHVHEIGHGFNGCIHDWTKETECPVKQKARSAQRDGDLLAGPYNANISVF